MLSLKLQSSLHRLTVSQATTSMLSTCFECYISCIWSGLATEHILCLDWFNRQEKS